MSEALPVFRYHPDPVATGSIVAADGECLACGRQRGHIYAGPVYALDLLHRALCPWCIADGTAAQRFDASYTDVGAGVPPEVPREVVEEISRRTPGYSSWQQDLWLYHCGDGCAFLGPVGHDELRQLPLEAAAAVLTNVRTFGWNEDQVQAFVDALDRNDQPTGYLFRCLRCGAYQAHCDFT